MINFGGRRRYRALKIPRINRYTNPYFRRDTKPKKSARFYYSLILLGLALAAWVYFLFASSIFQITGWELNGLKKYSNQEISASLEKFLNKPKFAIFKFSNIFIFSEKELRKHIESDFIFKSIEIKKYYPNKIIVSAAEKEEKLAVYSRDKIFVLADDGTVIKEKRGTTGWYVAVNATSTPQGSAGQASETKIDVAKILTDAETKELPSYPIFCDAYFDTQNIKVGDKYPAQKILEIAFQFIENAAEQIGLKTSSVALYKNNTNPKIIIFAENNWEIYLSADDDGLQQFYKFLTVFNSKIKDLGKSLEYIDLRFGDRVYIK